MAKARKNKKRGRSRIITIRVKGERKGKRPTVEDVEEAIQRKLATEPTDLFGNSDTVVIVLDDEGS